VWETLPHTPPEPAVSITEAEVRLKESRRKTEGREGEGKKEGRGKKESVIPLGAAETDLQRLDNLKLMEVDLAHGSKVWETQA
jgi:hypothetical protein